MKRGVRPLPKFHLPTFLAPLIFQSRMKKFFFSTAVFFLCIFQVCVFSGCLTKNLSTAETTVRAGVAEIDITPPIGHRMAGYFDERFATGIHDPLHAKAIVLEQGGEKFAFVFCDLVGLSLHVSAPARKDASVKTGIPIANILIASTHTHTGPLFDDVRRKFLHEDAIKKLGNDPHETIYYPKFLEEKLVKVITEANSRIAPAHIEVGIAKQYGISFNRRYRMKNGTVAFNPGQLNPNIVAPAGPIDPDVGMLIVRNAGGKPIAGLTVFAMHADTTGGTLYSADYPFFLQQTLRSAFGPKYISAFAAGTCGDINQINTGVKEQVKGFEVSERLGSTLGKTVLNNLSNAQPISNPSFARFSKTITAPLQPVTPAQLADAQAKIPQLGDTNAGFFMKVQAVKVLDLAEKGTNWPMEVQVFRLNNDTAIVGLPCEIFVDLGLAIKAASPFKKTIVMTICNDRPSYVPTAKAFKEGSYEISNARVQPVVGQMLVDTAVELLNQAKSSRSESK
jgi:hypothetical protein